jgi:ketosteroid isomerase-like protein
MEALDVVELGDGRFVVNVRFWGKGRRSGAEVDQRFASIYTLRPGDNKIARCQFFRTFEGAMDFATRSPETSG